MTCKCERHSFSFTFCGKSITEKPIFTDSSHSTAKVNLILITTFLSILVLRLVVSQHFFLVLTPLLLNFPFATLSLASRLSFPFLPSFLKLPQAVAQLSERKKLLFSPAGLIDSTPCTLLSVCVFVGGACVLASTCVF